jgi:hypothetical protein
MVPIIVRRKLSRVSCRPCDRVVRLATESYDGHQTHSSLTLVQIELFIHMHFLIPHTAVVGEQHVQSTADNAALLPPRLLLDSTNAPPPSSPKALLT